MRRNIQFQCLLFFAGQWPALLANISFLWNSSSEIYKGEGPPWASCSCLPCFDARDKIKSCYLRALTSTGERKSEQHLRDPGWCEHFCCQRTLKILFRKEGSLSPGDWIFIHEVYTSWPTLRSNIRKMGGFVETVESNKTHRLWKYYTTEYRAWEHSSLFIVTHEWLHKGLRVVWLRAPSKLFSCLLCSPSPCQQLSDNRIIASRLVCNHAIALQKTRTIAQVFVFLQKHFRVILWDSGQLECF